MSVALRLEGWRFGRLVAVSRVGSDSAGRALWQCRCDCGESSVVKAGSLTSGNSQSCGCAFQDRKTGLRKTLVDLVGQTFGALTVVAISVAGAGSPRTKWSCRCACGEMVNVRADALRSGKTKSCGCLAYVGRTPAKPRPVKPKAPAIRRPSVAKIRTGLAKRYASEHRAWTSAKRRCFNEAAHNFKDYGGRGIRMCERWARSFKAFFEDMGAKPSPKHSIDRIDNDSGYDCGRCDDCSSRSVATANCRWGTKREQTWNRRNSLKVRLNDEWVSPREFSERTGVKMATVVKRARMLGADNVLSTPVRGYGRRRVA